MPTTTHFEEIANAVRQLPRDEKEALAEMLRDDLGSGELASREIESAWLEEANRRWDAYQRGEMSAYSSEEVFARVRERIRQTRG